MAKAQPRPVEYNCTRSQAQMQVHGMPQRHRLQSAQSHAQLACGSGQVSEIHDTLAREWSGWRMDEMSADR